MISKINTAILSHHTHSRSILGPIDMDMILIGKALVTRYLGSILACSLQPTLETPMKRLVILYLYLGCDCNSAERGYIYSNELKTYSTCGSSWAVVLAGAYFILHMSKPLRLRFISLSEYLRAV